MAQRQRACFLFFLVFTLQSLWLAGQSVPLSLNYQGKLNDSSGNPVNGVISIEFNIYDVAVGGNPLWTETFSMVSVNQGLFNVLLGSTVPIDPAVLSGASRYLEIRVANDPPMTPRQRILSAAFAIRSENASQSANSAALGGVVASDWQRRVTQACSPGSSIASISDLGTVTCEPDDGGITVETDPEVGAMNNDSVPRWNGSALVSGAISDNGANIGVGTTTPLAKLQVVGEVRTTDATNAPRLWGQGRAGNPRYGTIGPEQGLCTNGNIHFGLSWMAVSWDGSAAACPAGTWVCTSSERGNGICDTARVDTGADGYDCFSNNFFDWPANAHFGWLVDLPGPGTGLYGRYTDEQAFNVAVIAFGCDRFPVWCCSE